MNPSVIIILVIMYVVYYVIKGVVSSVNKQQKPPQTQQESTRSAPATARSGRGLMDMVNEYLENQSPAATPLVVQHVPDERRPSSQPVAQRENHFSEELLVEEYKRTHKKGKTVAHHTHDYFNREEDASKSPTKMTRRTAKAQSRRIRGTRSIRRAIIMNEILKRPKF